MAIDEELLKFRSVDHLFDEFGVRLCVPGFQRPYSWKPHNALQLCRDVSRALEENPHDDYVLGTVILHREVGADGLADYNIVDGQQRLVTLSVLRCLLNSEGKQPVPDTQTPLAAVTREMSRYVRELSGEAVDFKNYLAKRCTLLVVVTDDEDEAFQFFDSQNYRGKSLRPHDLLKAFHLREMRDQSIERQVAAVSGWEDIGEGKLDDLFTGVLARILRWSRHERSLDFTQDDIPMFKGLLAGRPGTPAADYHRAAQLLVPGVAVWRGDAAGDQGPHHEEQAERRQRDDQRIRFQLDAPILAGEHFFEMVAFMQSEVSRLHARYFGGASDDTGHTTTVLGPFSTDPRYRYCNELFLCAVLYYSNKFSEGDLHRNAPAIARWAYAPRLEKTRLGWRTVDNHARGQSDGRSAVHPDNLFARIRNAFTSGELGLEDITLSVHSDKYDALHRILESAEL
ncbi:GmrSD restriction endonuclease domain-containing protein [Dietzia natronolimnaea]|uniref:DUF7834 domain-containing protein n=1 Tax=Dietzia natronolimnaea TaxID=161920 RepID=UPI0015FD87E0|nr:DUF262 domain-containing protein [Dietzia natronolimnaea]